MVSFDMKDCKTWVPAQSEFSPAPCGRGAGGGGRASTTTTPAITPGSHHAEDRHRRRWHLHRPGRGGRRRPLHAGEGRLHTAGSVDRRDGRPGSSGRDPAPLARRPAGPDRAHRAWHHRRHQRAARAQGRPGRPAHHRGPSRRDRDARGPEGRSLQPAHAAAGAAGAARAAPRRHRAHARGRHDRDTAGPRLAGQRHRRIEASQRGGGGGLLPARLSRSAPRTRNRRRARPGDAGCVRLALVRRVPADQGVRPRIYNGGERLCRPGAVALSASAGAAAGRGRLSPARS